MEQTFRACHSLGARSARPRDRGVYPSSGGRNLSYRPHQAARSDPQSEGASQVRGISDISTSIQVVCGPPPTTQEAAPGRAHPRQLWEIRERAQWVDDQTSMAPNGCSDLCLRSNQRLRCRCRTVRSSENAAPCTGSGAGNYWRIHFSRVRATAGSSAQRLVRHARNQPDNSARSLCDARAVSGRARVP